MTTKAGDDDIDLEALQAQVDLTMAHAHELASSWVNPSLRSSGAPTQSWEKELEQHMRRPPRLGVGAPIPESTIGHREMTRLKNNLTNKGKKREREKGGGEDEGRMQVSSDEGESRASAIKKKPKPDAQHALGKKSGNTLPTVRSPPGRPIAERPSEDVEMENGENDEASNEVQPTASTHVQELSKSAKKKQMKKLKKLAAIGSGHLSAPASAPCPPEGITSSLRTNSSVDKTDHIKRWHPPMSPSLMGIMNKTSPQKPESFSKLLAATPVFLASAETEGTSPTPPHSEYHLLNLDRPRESASQGEDQACTPSGTPKKKGRRRNKRKSSYANASSLGSDAVGL